jgi:RNA polymerase sigma factor (sigma-70 family)
MVCDAHLAEDVTQVAFVALAQNARELTHRPVLSGWLHRTAQNLATKVVRTEARRRAREHEAAAMNELLSAEADTTWKHIAPQLDAALGELSEPDRDALLLRYFERKSASEMAQTLGISDEAAQKRVNRAVERLREFFAKRGVTVGAGGLAAVISANAVQAAPVGLAVAISTAAALAGTTLATTATATAVKIIVMTTLQKTLIAAAFALAVGTGIYEAHQAANARADVQKLEQQQSSLTDQIKQLQSERDDATNRLSRIGEANALAERQRSELLRLRGELTRSKAALQELALLKAVILHGASDPTEMAITNWAARALELQKRIERMPEAQIPEFAFLTPNDWLDISKDASLETDKDFQNAADMLGANAKNTFARLAKDALNKFLEANAGALPSEMSQLRPFFPSPVEDVVLQRYELLQSGNVKDVAESDRMYRLVGEKRFAPVGSGRPIVSIGTGGFIRAGQ